MANEWVARPGAASIGPGGTGGVGPFAARRGVPAHESSPVPLWRMTSLTVPP